MSVFDGMLDDPIGAELAVEYGLSPQEWRVALDKYKSPFSRRVVVAVRHVKSGRQLEDTLVGRYTKRQLDAEARRLVAALAERLR
jgi:hypothetical protein